MTETFVESCQRAFKKVYASFTASTAAWLDSVAPDAVTMEDALARIERDDPWEGFFKVDQSLA